MGSSSLRVIRPDGFLAIGSLRGATRSAFAMDPGNPLQRRVLVVTGECCGRVLEFLSVLAPLGGAGVAFESGL
jgi:hypothetical protein